MKPRLLVLASTYPRWTGDPEPGFVHELAKRLLDKFDVTVLCPHAPGAATRELMEGVTVVRYHYAPEQLETLVNDGGIITNLKRAKWKLLLVPSFVLMQAWQAWRLVRSGKVDVIHAHWVLPQGLIAALLPSLPGKSVPFLVTSHGADLYALRGKILDALKRFVLRKAASATVVSAAMCEHLQMHGMDMGHVSVMPMGVDMTGRFHPDANIPRSSGELLFVGRLVEKKGLRYLLEAMPIVLQSFPEVRLTVAGFGPEEVALKMQAYALGIDKQVRFIGAVPQAQLPSLYRRAALFVAPFVRAESGDEEGLGLVLVEAIGCGCPVIVGNVPAVYDVLGTRASTNCIDPRDTHLFARRIINELSREQPIKSEESDLRETVAGKFDWANVAASYAKQLENSQFRGRQHDRGQNGEDA